MSTVSSFSLASNVTEETKRIVNEKKKDGWTCTQCTLINTLAVPNCVACGKIRPWKCIKCTYQNVDGLHQCSMCNEYNSEMEHVKIARYPDDSWDCPRCRRKNQWKVKHCIHCSFNKQATKKRQEDFDSFTAPFVIFDPMHNMEHKNLEDANVLGFLEESSVSLTSFNKFNSSPLEYKRSVSSVVVSTSSSSSSSSERKFLPMVPVSSKKNTSSKKKITNEVYIPFWTCQNHNCNFQNLLGNCCHKCSKYDHRLKHIEINRYMDDSWNCPGCRRRNGYQVRYCIYCYFNKKHVDTHPTLLVTFSPMNVPKHKKLDQNPTYFYDIFNNKCITKHIRHYFSSELIKEEDYIVDLINSYIIYKK